MAKWRVIGISGVTCGGKTTLALKLLEKYTDSILINQDDFFRLEDDPHHEWVDLSPTVRHQNWESMVSVNWEAFTRAVQQTLDKGPPNDSAFLIIEGHLIFNYKPISDLCEKKYFITLEKEECFARRERRQYLPRDPKGYFDGWIWPMYLKNKQDMLTIHSNNHINGSLDPEDVYETAIKSISS